VAKVRRIKFYRDCRKAVLIAVAISLPLLAAGYVVSGGLDRFATAATAALDRFATVVNAPVAGRLSGSIGPTSRPVARNLGAAPLMLDLTGPAVHAIPAIQSDAGLPQFGGSIVSPDLSAQAVGAGIAPGQDSAGDASRLFAMGKALLATGQMAGAREMFRAAARMGNLDAAAFVVNDALASASLGARPIGMTPASVGHAGHAATGMR
jgi:hypothetical protein